MTEVVDLPFQHRDSLEAHAESESAVFLAVYPGSLEDVRVDHSATQDLKPAGTLAYVATLSMADIATDIDLAGGLGEREI